ncbi:hypothetical protein D9758_016489 [Tetrapyrgos nigripes]|uniref:DUF6534 domain-containing protein n=1 Tax=Tetrapyrgos nigripes TaxID=182062 RepID=A0A8H5FNH8_9AGAR|nr:hypothetical protein D9758_016489 [Tetrapyrgos nigripes]
MSFLTNTFGCLLISMLLTFILYGAVLVMAAQYFLEYRSDTVVLKASIVVFLAVGTIHVVAGFAWVYEVLIDRFGQILKLDFIPTSAVIQMGTIFLWNENLDFIQVQTPPDCANNFHRSRSIQPWDARSRSRCCRWTLEQYLHRQGKSYSLIDSAVSIQADLQFEQKIIIGQEALSVANDILITAELCFLLHLSRSGIRATDSLITRLLIEALNRGIISSALAALALALYLYRPTTMLFEIPTNMIGQGKYLESTYPRTDMLMPFLQFISSASLEENAAQEILPEKSYVLVAEFIFAEYTNQQLTQPGQ